MNALGCHSEAWPGSLVQYNGTSSREVFIQGKDESSAFDDSFFISAVNMSKPIQ